MKNLSTLDKLYLIPILGLIIAIIWWICDINYIENRMNRKVMFYGGLICHILIGEILGIVLTVMYLK